MKLSNCCSYYRKNGARSRRFYERNRGSCLYCHASVRVPQSAHPLPGHLLIPRLRLVRDLIYTFLYTRSRPINIHYKRAGIPPSSDLFPQDPYLYLNSAIVDPVIAAEATRILFFTNRFNVVAQSGSRVSVSTGTAVLKGAAQRLPRTPLIATLR
jgi:hypothetical protein